MSGETDLGVILATLNARCDAVEYGYATLPTGNALPHELELTGTFAEAEGLTVIAPVAALEDARLAHQPGWAQLTLEIHSSLQAVGVTAAIAAALGEAGISANVVAAYYHDHVFVPWSRRDEAVAVLDRLRRSAADTPAPTG